MGQLYLLSTWRRQLANQRGNRQPPVRVNPWPGMLQLEQLILDELIAANAILDTEIQPTCQVIHAHIVKARDCLERVSAGEVVVSFVTGKGRPTDTDIGSGHNLGDTLSLS